MDFLPPTRANERAMLAAFADARLIVFVKIAGDGIGHRSDNQRAAVSERTKLIRLQKPKSLHRHLDQRIGQSLCRGLLEPLFQVFGERRHCGDDNQNALAGQPCSAALTGLEILFDD